MVMDIPQLAPESKPSVFKVWSFDGADQLTHPWMCQTEFGIREFAHWDQAIDYALSLNPKPAPMLSDLSVGDMVRFRQPWLSDRVYTGEILSLYKSGAAYVRFASGTWIVNLSWVTLL